MFVIQDAENSSLMYEHCLSINKKYLLEKHYHPIKTG